MYCTEKSHASEWSEDISSIVSVFLYHLHIYLCKREGKKCLDIKKALIKRGFSLN